MRDGIKTADSKVVSDIATVSLKINKGIIITEYVDSLCSTSLNLMDI